MPHPDDVINQKYNISARQKGHPHPFVVSAFRPPRHYKKSPPLVCLHMNFFLDTIDNSGDTSIVGVEERLAVHIYKNRCVSLMIMKYTFSFFSLDNVSNIIPMS